MDWILICKLCKFGKYICYNFRGIKFFLCFWCTLYSDCIRTTFETPSNQTRHNSGSNQNVLVVLVLHPKCILFLNIPILFQQHSSCTPGPAYIGIWQYAGIIQCWLEANSQYSNGILEKLQELSSTWNPPIGARIFKILHSDWFFFIPAEWCWH